MNTRRKLLIALGAGAITAPFANLKTANAPGLSLAQIAEFKRAARYPKLRPYIPRGGVGRLVIGLRSAQVLLKRLPGGIDSPDPGDAYLMAMAIVARADFLVTGDGALLSMRKFGVTKIVSPKSFSAILAR